MKKNLFSKSIFFLLFSFAIFCLFMLAKPVNANTTEIIQQVCGTTGATDLHCDAHITLDKTDYNPGEHIDVQWWLDSSDSYFYSGYVGVPTDVSFNGVTGTTGCMVFNGIPCKRADSSLITLNAPAVSGCYNLNVFYKWTAYGTYSYTKQIPYTVGGGCSGGGGTTYSPPPALSLSANPGVIGIGQTANVVWNSVGASDCLATETNSNYTSVLSVLPPAHTVAGSSSVAYNNLGTRYYRLECTPTGVITYSNSKKKFIGFGNYLNKIKEFFTPKALAEQSNSHSFAYATIQVAPVTPTVNLSFEQNPINSGEFTTVSWSATNATDCELIKPLDLKPKTGTENTFSSGVRFESTDFEVLCTNIPNGTSKSASDTLVVTGLPELTASQVSPTNATLPSTTTFFSTITNQGLVSTGATPFTNLFQTASSFDDAGNPVGLKNYPVTGMTDLAGKGGSSQISKSIFLTATDRYIRSCADKSSSSNTGVISESDEGNNCSGWVQLIALPDLTALAPTIVQSTIQAGTPVTLRSVVKNNGSVSTVNSFSTFFQKSISDPNGTPNQGAFNYGEKDNFFTYLFYKKAVAAGGGGGGTQTIFDLTPVVTVPVITAGANQNADMNYTFTSNGMYWIRACADKSSSINTGTITEINENNNCSSWTPVTVGSAVVGGSCGATHYLCTTGSSTNQVSGTTSWTWDCVGSNGATVSCSEQKLVMTGTLTPQVSSCMIPKGESSCGIKFSWAVLNPIAPITAVVKPVNTFVAGGNGVHVGNKILSVKYNGETFFLYNNGQLLDQESVASYCEPGSKWDGTLCLEENPFPDLVVGPITPTVVPKDSLVKFNATVTNQGNLTTGTYFWNLFQLSNNIGIQDISPSVKVSPFLSAGSSRDISVNKTFSSTDSVYMRACADKQDKEDLGIISEGLPGGLYENNNCGPWTQIIVSDSKTDGQCGTSLYSCAPGTSTNNVNNGTSWTWDCEGFNGGGTKSCEKTTCPNGASNPTACTFGGCENGAVNPTECTLCEDGSIPNPTCPTGSGTCFNKVKDGDETGVDCGGTKCVACKKKPKYIER